MSFLNRTVAWSIILKNFIIIAGIVLAIFLLAISVYANATENRPIDTGLPKPPSISRAAWEVKIINTGNILYTNSYEHPSDNLYILHGYWEIDNNKYEKHKNDLVIDEIYFGGIIIEKRVK